MAAVSTRRLATIMRECILHIGLHKTGTSSIQQSLYRNPTVRGVDYPDLGRPNGSGPMLAAR